MFSMFPGIYYKQLQILLTIDRVGGAKYKMKYIGTKKFKT